MTSLDWKDGDFAVYYYLQLANLVKCILKDLFISIIKEQWSDQGECN
jgi:hypothetical protein